MRAAPPTIAISLSSALAAGAREHRRTETTAMCPVWWHCVVCGRGVHVVPIAQDGQLVMLAWYCSPHCIAVDQWMDSLLGAEFAPNENRRQERSGVGARPRRLPPPPPPFADAARDVDNQIAESKLPATAAPERPGPTAITVRIPVGPHGGMALFSLRRGRRPPPGLPPPAPRTLPVADALAIGRLWGLSRADALRHWVHSLPR